MLSGKDPKKDCRAFFIKGACGQIGMRKVHLGQKHHHLSKELSKDFSESAVDGKHNDLQEEPKEGFK